MNNVQKVLKRIEKTSVKIEEQEVLDLLKIRRRWPRFYPWNEPSLEVINMTGLKTTAFFAGDNYLDYNEWFKYYDLGFTSVLSGILDLTKDLRNLGKILTEELGFLPHSNLYFSKPGESASFPPHVHSYNVIVKQIYGNSDWIIGDKKIKLSPQKTLLSPKDITHQVVTKKDKKLSLTINIDGIGLYS